MGTENREWKGSSWRAALCTGSFHYAEADPSQLPGQRKILHCLKLDR